MRSSMPKQTKVPCLKGGTSLSLARGSNQHLETASSLHLRAMIEGKTKNTRRSFSSSTDKKAASTKPAGTSLAEKQRSRLPPFKSKPMKNGDVLSGGSLKDAPTYKKKPPAGGALDRLAQAVALTHPNQRPNNPSNPPPKSIGIGNAPIGPLKGAPPYRKKKKASHKPGALERLAQSVDLLARPNKRLKIAGKENPFIRNGSTQLPSNARKRPILNGSSLFSSQRTTTPLPPANKNGDRTKKPEPPKAPVFLSTEPLAITASHSIEASQPVKPQDFDFLSDTDNSQPIEGSQPIKPQDFDFLSDTDNSSITSTDKSRKIELEKPIGQSNPRDIPNKTLSLGVNIGGHKKKITFASSDINPNSRWKSLLQDEGGSSTSSLCTDGEATISRDTTKSIAKNEKADFIDSREEGDRPQNQSTEDANNTRKGLEALAPIPVPNRDHESSKVKPSENFVKLNMRNKAGSCRGARNKKGKTKSQIKWENRKREYQQKMSEYESSSMGAKRDYSVASGGALTHDGVDPVDDLLDGAYATKAKASNSLTTSLPLCSGHRQPCKQLKVKKTSSGNKGREFFCCALPRGEQCNYFKWVDDTKEAVQKALMQNKSYSGFVARQVQSYMESIKEMTVPELRNLARKRGLVTTGKRKEILMRLSLWTRNELINASSEEGNNSAFPQTDDLEDPADESGSKESGDSDDDSLELSSSDSSDEELEISGPVPSNHDGGKQTNLHTPIDSCDADQAEYHLDYHRALKRYFGFSSFRPGQEWAIRRCLEQKRSLLVAPTGSGKSLCYALPAAMMEGVCIVVSPLLSLIQDQIRVLPPSIPSASLSGQMSTMKMTATLDDISKGRQKVVFVSPEKLTSASFRRLFIPRWNRETNRSERFFPDVSLLCIDECHVLSQWGHNFRPSYLRLKTMVDMICPKSILAITATAGPRVVTDICESLGITQQRSNEECGKDQSLSNEPDSDDSNGVQALESNRDNIEVACEILSSQEDRISRLISLLKPSRETSRKSTLDSVFGSGSIIVYVWRQRDAEAVAENLNSAGIQGGVCVYHGGMETGARATAQSKFLRQKARVCVATVAFGLGINATFVEGIIHMYLPPSPENYLQEIGRAGRDGRQAFAMALVLQEEVLVRHSLAHTDGIALSQVNALLRILCKQTQNSLSKIREKPNRLSIGILTVEAVAMCGFKAETVETLLSLLEAGLHDDSYLRIDGFFYDRATLAPRRCNLDELVSREDVLKAVKQCCVCLEPAAGEGRDSFGHSDARRASDEHGFGSFQFSVADCANCLGPNAEPRHVFAALRRLQNVGEIDFNLDTGHSGRGLNVRLTGLGVDQFGTPGRDIKGLALRLYESFNATVKASASKVLQIDSILRNVSLSEDSSDRDENAKSKTLCLFQSLMKNYFSKERDPDDEENKMENCESFDPPPKAHELVRDLEPVLLYLEETDRASQLVDRLKLDDPKHQDFAVLSATKFLHGLVPSTLDLHRCRAHHLFGRYQRTKFADLHEAILKAVTKGTTTSNKIL